MWIGRTDDPIYSSIMVARMVNELSGGTVVTPWDVYELPDDWLDAFTELQATINQKAKG